MIHSKLLTGLTCCLFFAGCSEKLDTSDRDACKKQLRMIDGAKQQWMVTHQNSTNVTISWDDIWPLLTLVGDQLPTCPGGGAYTLGGREQSPSCSIAEHGAD